MPVYKDGRQVGRATTTAWSTTLKKLIALATIDRPHFGLGTTVDLEITVEAVRHTAAATVVKTPFFNPPRKTATPPAVEVPGFRVRSSEVRRQHPDAIENPEPLNLEPLSASAASRLRASMNDRTPSAT